LSISPPHATGWKKGGVREQLSNAQLPAAMLNHDKHSSKLISFFYPTYFQNICSYCSDFFLRICFLFALGKKLE